MGGGGNYYDRDVTPRARTSRSATTAKADEALSKTSSLHPEMNCYGRRLTCSVPCPLFYAFDGTGSMGVMPRTLWDKMPMIVGQIIARAYLSEFQMCLGVVGDEAHDQAPIQVGKFGSPREIDKWFTRAYIEGGGGGNKVESYALLAFYLAYYTDLENATHPFCVFTADEGLYTEIPPDVIRKHIDPKYKGPKDPESGKEIAVTTDLVFNDLLKKFHGNVFLVHRYYNNYGGSHDQVVVDQWIRYLGRERVIVMPHTSNSTEDDRTVGDITLGLFAVASGARSLDEYLEDMASRPLGLAADATFEPQSPERIEAVRQSLSVLTDFRPQLNLPGRLGLVMDT